MRKFLFISMVLLSVTALGQNSKYDTLNYNVKIFDWILYDLEESKLKPAIKTEEYRIWINDFKDMSNSWTLVTLTRNEGEGWAINAYDQINSLGNKKSFKRAAKQVDSAGLFNTLNNIIATVPNNKDLRYHLVDINTTPQNERLDFAVDYENHKLKVRKRMWSELNAHYKTEWIEHLQDQKIKEALLLLYPAVAKK